MCQHAGCKQWSKHLLFCKFFYNNIPIQICPALQNFSYIPVLSEARSEDNWQGRSGFVHQAIATDYPDLSAYDVYCGGPPVMVSSGFELFAGQGLGQDQFFSDAFEYAHAS